MNEMGTEPPTYAIGSVDNALQVLELVKRDNSIRVSDVARALGIARSSAHRMLAMLVYRGYLRHDPATRAYLAGPALLQLGLAVVRNMDIRKAARPVMERAAAATGETTSLVLLDGQQVLFVDCIEGTHSLRVGSRTGLTMQAHCTAPGKVMLALLSPATLRELYPEDQLSTMTDRSISTFADLEAELAQVRRKGYATNLMESEDDISAVAVALKSATGTPEAAITVAGPSSRLSRDRMRHVAEVLRNAADGFTGVGAA